MDIIHRNRYFEKLKPYIGKQIIKVFTGQRRVGKSFMMFQMIEYTRQLKPEANIIYIDKEKNEFDSIQEYQHLYDYIIDNTHNGLNVVLIDEIQEIEGFEKALRSLYTNSQYDIYCTGSNANMLSGELATLLSGRYVEIPIHSLSFKEFLEFHKLENTNQSLQKYLKFGGLPNLIHLPLQDEIIYDYLNNIYASILFKDVIRRYSIRNVSFLENLTTYLSDNLGSIVSSKKISDFLKSQNVKISPNVVLDYISHLCSTYFIEKVKRRDVIGKKIFEIGEKYYFEDIGLRNSIVGYKPNDIGKIIENVIYSHLKIEGWKVEVGTWKDKEIDFVAQKNGELLYVQACYLLHDEKTIEREFGNLLLLKDNYPKMVVSMDEMFGENTYKGIAHFHLREFLSSKLQGFGKQTFRI